MTDSLFLQHLEQLRQKLSHQSPQELYEKLMALGKKTTPLSSEAKTPENRVHGCQSLMYLKTELTNGRLQLQFASDALISAGLAAVACELMNGLTPEEALKADLKPIETLGIAQALTPGRVTGLGSVLQKIRKDALGLLMKK
jgi:cysteine desulfuration protein SufE